MKLATVPARLVLGLALSGAACGDEVSPTSPDLLVTTSTTELFVGTLPVGGTRFYSYTVTQPGSVFLTLASLTSSGNRPAASRVILGFGIPAGTGCALRDSTMTSAALTSQLQHSATPGIYCVNVADADGLPSDMAFAVRIVHP